MIPITSAHIPLVEFILYHIQMQDKRRDWEMKSLAGPPLPSNNPRRWNESIYFGGQLVFLPQGTTGLLPISDRDVCLLLRV